MPASDYGLGKAEYMDYVITWLPVPSRSRLPSSPAVDVPSLCDICHVVTTGENAASELFRDRLVHCDE